MAGPPHHFMPGVSQQGRNQFGGAIQNQMANAMQSQLVNQMQGQIGAQMANQMMNQMSSQMNPTMGAQMNNQMGHGMGGQLNVAMASQMNGMNAAGNQMLGQINPQYGMSPASQMQQANSMQQMQPQTMGIQHHNPIQQQQQNQNVPQVLQQNANVEPTPIQPPPSQQQRQPAKEFNTASLCRIGQETVQDIVSRTQEVFQTLKQIQPPNGTPQGSNQSNDKIVKVQEQLRTIRLLFKRLRLIYEKCNENSQIQGMEYTHIESLIPYKDEIDPKHDEKKNSEAYRSSCEEMKEVMEQVWLKNKQLKDVIDLMRRIIWEINTMLTMRRS